MCHARRHLADRRQLLRAQHFAFTLTHPLHDGTDSAGDQMEHALQVADVCSPDEGDRTDQRLQLTGGRPDRHAELDQRTTEAAGEAEAGRQPGGATADSQRQQDVDQPVRQLLVLGDRLVHLDLVVIQVGVDRLQDLPDHDVVNEPAHRFLQFDQHCGNGSDGLFFSLSSSSRNC